MIDFEKYIITLLAYNNYSSDNIINIKYFNSFKLIQENDNSNPEQENDNDNDLLIREYDLINDMYIPSINELEKKQSHFLILKDSYFEKNNYIVFVQLKTNKYLFIKGYLDYNNSFSTNVDNKIDISQSDVIVNLFRYNMNENDKTIFINSVFNNIIKSYIPYNQIEYDNYIISKWNKICDIINQIVEKKSIYDIFDCIKDELINFNFYLLYSYIIDCLYRTFFTDFDNLSDSGIDKTINIIIEPFQKLYFDYIENNNIISAEI